MASQRRGKRRIQNIIGESDERESERERERESNSEGD